MTNEHRRSAPWYATPRAWFFVAALAAIATAIACEESGPSPIGTHPNDAGQSPEPEPEPDASDTEAGADDAGDAGDAGEISDATIDDDASDDASVEDADIEDADADPGE